MIDLRQDAAEWQIIVERLLSVDGTATLSATAKAECQLLVCWWWARYHRSAQQDQA